MEQVSIPEYYTNKSVFITGATGFIGTVLIQKLLYYCPKIKSIYVLLRTKRGNESATRISEITNSPVFETIKNETPDVINKIIPIAGDIKDNGLGISEEDLNELINEVSVVVHLAATVNFLEPLRDAIALNVGGTRELIKICHKMKKLQALVHVSTTFSNCNRLIVEEKVYPPPEDLETIDRLVQSVDESFTQQILDQKNYPNTYTFTKALGEHCVATTHGNIPVAIVRPSIVLSTHDGPAKGWVCNLNGPSGLACAALKKALFSMPGDGNCISDFIPVDIVANTILISATSLRRPGELKVYNCCSGISNPIRWYDFTRAIIINDREYSRRRGLLSIDYLFPAYVQITSNFYIHWLITILLQFLPAYLLQVASFFTMKKSIALKVQKRILYYISFSEYITSHQWLCLDTNFRSLLQSMSPEDRKMFNIDVKSIHWNSYFSDYISGLRKYLLKMKN